MANLYEQYTQAGQALPSVQERQPLAQQAGIQDYSGTAEQNTALGNYITSNKIDLSKPITASQLNTPAPVIPGTQTNPYAGLSAGSTAITSNLTQPPYVAPAPTDALQQYLKTNEGIEAPNQANIQSELEKQAGIEQKTQETNRLKAQIETNIAEAEAAKLSQEGRLASFGAVSGAQRDIDRQLAIKNLPLTAQYQAALGDLQGAQNTVTKLFTAKLADAQNKYDNAKEIAKVAYQYATDKEKAQIEAAQKIKDREYEAEKQQIALDNDKELAKYRAGLETTSVVGGSDTTGQNGIIITNTGKPLNDTQATAYGYAQRLLEANQTINRLGSAFTGVSSYLGQVLPNIMKNEERQQYEQAQRNFINAVLRKESGAVISPEEFKNARQQYFPQPGDKTGTVTQKAQNRETAINNLYRSAGVAGQQGQKLNTPEDLRSKYNY